MTKISKAAIRDKSPKLLTDEGRWQALVNKDERADGLFWFSVKTTGVYCRPSCPARLPKRENVIFHLSPEDAEKAGFRACKRCDPKGRGLASQHSKAVATACRLIREAENFPNLNQLAESAKMSPGYFHRLFKATTGLTPKEYADAHRSDRVKKALPKWETVTEAIYDAGYNSNGRFYAGSSKILKAWGVRMPSGRLDSIPEFLRHVRKSCRRRRRIATPASRATETDRSRVGRRMDDRYSDAVTGDHVTPPTPGAARLPAIPGVMMPGTLPKAPESEDEKRGCNFAESANLNPKSEDGMRMHRENEWLFAACSQL